MSEMLSYANIIKDLENFKRSGTYSGTGFNVYDTPAHKYFKILFYFGSDPEDGKGNSSGLLAPTWEVFKPLTLNDLLGVNWKDLSAVEITDATARMTAHNNRKDYHNYNSAWSFLKLNDEEERAEKLEQFVTLLSDISSNAPWYFSSISGINDALDRKYTEDGKLEMDTPKTLSITCLPDAFDNRMTTLLDLYRDITWSWVNKREVIPSNLRKFDMAIYIFETPEAAWHEVKGGLLSKDTVIDNKSKTEGLLGVLSPSFKPSYKMIEFHDCEFKYNSVKSGWNELNNQTGFNPTYTIEIMYNDCYEISYNDIMMRTIGDVILTDMLNSSAADDYISKAQADDMGQSVMIKNKTNPYDNGFIIDAISQCIGTLKSSAVDWVKGKLMGNIFGFSLTRLRDQAKDFLEGNIIKTGMTVAKYAKLTKNKHAKQESPTGNIYSDTNASVSNQKPTGDLFPEPVISNQNPTGDLFKEVTINNAKGKALGNLFKPSTIANN